ncbi:MAG: FtsW/RodA/SpoVE family cell cycle protein [Sphaerochaeta sp.]
MARTSYDDWNFMGEAQPVDLRPRGTKTHKIQQMNSYRKSFIFLCAVIILTLTGLVCVYSASFEASVAQGLPHYHFLLKQCVYTAIGAGLMILVNLLPQTVIKLLGPVMFFACLVVMTVGIFLKKSFLLTPDTVNFLFLSGVMYMAVYFSGRGNRIERLRQLIPPAAGCMLVLGLILIQKNFSYALMFLALSATMFAAGGVGFMGVLLLLLYAAVPALCSVLTKSERILAIARFLIPGLGENPRASELLTVKSAIASGSWFGKGLGGGTFKNGIISEISGRNILACISEELGFGGIVMIALFIAFYAFVGYTIAKSVRKYDGFSSNLAIGLTTMVVWQFILNFAWTLGYIPGEGLPMPFFSYGTGIIPVLIESALIYRITRFKFDAAENDKVLESIQDELMFPERYELENN